MLQDLLRQRQEKEELERQAELDARSAEVEKFKGVVTDTLGSIYDELAPQYGWDSGPFVNLHYRGYKRSFRPGHRFDNTLSMDNVLSWAESVDADIEKKQRQQAEARPNIVSCIKQWYLSDAKDAMRRHGLSDDPELRAMLDKATAERDEQLRLKKEEDERNLQAEVEKAVAKLGALDDSSSIRTFFDSLSYDARTSKPVRAAADEALDRAEARYKERETARIEGHAKAEAKLFHPFTVYRIMYSTVADGEDGPCIERDWFWSADCCPANGWWKPLDGNPLCLPYPPLIEEVKVGAVEQYPNRWPLTVETEWGWVKVPL